MKKIILITGGAGFIGSNLCEKLLNDGHKIICVDLTIYGNGEQTRSFSYIDDQLDGLIKLMNSNYVYPVNIGNPYEINMMQLANTILKLIKSSSSIVL